MTRCLNTGRSGELHCHLALIIVVVVLPCTLCLEKRDQDVFVMSSTKLGQFWWNLIRGFLNKFVTKSCKGFPLHLNNVYTLPCETWNDHCTRATTVFAFIFVFLFAFFFLCIFFYLFIFVSLQRGLATRKLCPSVCQTCDCDKTKESCAHILIFHETSFILVLWQEEWLVGRSLLPEILGQTDPIGAKTPILNPYSLV